MRKRSGGRLASLSWYSVDSSVRIYRRTSSLLTKERADGAIRRTRCSVLAGRVDRSERLTAAAKRAGTLSKESREISFPFGVSNRDLMFVRLHERERERERTRDKRRKRSRWYVVEHVRILFAVARREARCRGSTWCRARWTSDAARVVYNGTPIIRAKSTGRLLKNRKKKGKIRPIVSSAARSRRGGGAAETLNLGFIPRGKCFAAESQPR